MDKLTPKETSKGAEEIVLTQIKQDFITPANAIFDYVDMVEQVLNDAELQSEEEVEQIKSSCSKLIDQYEVALYRTLEPMLILQKNHLRSTLNFVII